MRAREVLAIAVAKLQAVHLEKITCLVEVNAVSLDGVSNGSWTRDLLLSDFYRIFVAPHECRQSGDSVEFL